MAETSADAPPPPPPPPPKSNKEKKREWHAATKKGKRQRKKARRTRIDAIFNALLDHYNAIGSANPPATGGDTIRVLREIAEVLEEERNPHTHAREGIGGTWRR
ncbi:hypothetical protein N7537_001834 [Penicillium hordei]|uniref:Uncharacterized protein n=1 Tax=Penicillium hordei TaxID=40994 RepID=A0AAD6EHG2_9EURO|nr:uncharacterized protein N7537_001834 [Penicillium hordei]KAJ5616720.1 hypothetical protein N7537_001834 [Penicillium hordei]